MTMTELTTLNSNTQAFLDHLDRLPDPDKISDPELIRIIIASLREFADGFMKLSRIANETDDPDRDVAASTATAIAARVRAHIEPFSRRLLVLNPTSGGARLH